jgi:hypothetical protein
MKDLSAIEQSLRQSGQAGKLMEAVSDADKKRLEGLVDREKLGAALQSGDTKSLENILRQVLSTGGGKALAQKIAGVLGK